MNKSDLVEALALNCHLAQNQSEEVVELIFKKMQDTLVNGGRIEIRGLFSFGIKDYNSYLGRNPKTTEKIMVKQKKLPVFKMGKELKERLNRQS